jgi:hypothetical protein
MTPPAALVPLPLGACGSRSQNLDHRDKAKPTGHAYAAGAHLFDPFTTPGQASLNGPQYAAELSVTEGGPGSMLGVTAQPWDWPDCQRRHYGDHDRRPPLLLLSGNAVYQGKEILKLFRPRPWHVSSGATRAVCSRCQPYARVKNWRPGEAEAPRNRTSRGTWRSNSILSAVTENSSAVDRKPRISPVPPARQHPCFIPARAKRGRRIIPPPGTAVAPFRPDTHIGMIGSASPDHLRDTAWACGI